MAVITNIDLEHLETYADLDDIKNCFTQFLNNLPVDSKAVICNDDANIQSLLPLKHIKTISYGIEHESDFCARDIILNADHSIFTVYTKQNNTPLGTIMLPIAGKHNVYNSLAAIAVAQELGISFETITKSLTSFGGVARRFSFHGIYQGAEIFDDYGHHPKEIEYTLNVARKRTHNKLIVVFQPHRYTRTQKLWNDFLSTFATSNIDHLIITDIYSAGEYPIPTITSKRLVQELQNLNPSFTLEHIPFEDDFTLIKQSISRSIGQNDLLLFLGAGKVHLIADDITE